jgi:hypothetical protein
VTTRVRRRWTIRHAARAPTTSAATTAAKRMIFKTNARTINATIATATTAVTRTKNCIRFLRSDLLPRSRSGFTVRNRTVAFSTRTLYREGTMDGVTGIPGSSAAAVAANGTSMLAVNVLKSTQNLMADEVSRLFASIGIGANFNAAA